MQAPARSTAERIGQLAHARPEIALGSAGAAAPLLAVWAHAPVETEIDGLPQHAVALQLGGSTLVHKWTDGRPAGHRARVGCVTLVPAHRRTRWVIEGPAEVAHVYVDAAALQAAHAAGGGRGSAVPADFFSVDDRPLAGLVVALVRQARAAGAAAPTALEPLARDQLEQRLLQHLLHGYCDGVPPPAPAQRIALTGCTLRRLYTHIEDRLDTPLRLAELASVAHLSADHFLRAFGAAVGCTPGRYVLERRLARAALLLRATRLPAAEIAARVGFRSASHFAAAFRQRRGVSPTAWRALE